jgi:hypothetical protein
MATQVFRVDDMNGELIEEGTPPVKFTIEGAAYEIDLTAANRKAFHDLIHPYAAVARPKGGKKLPTTQAGSASSITPAGAATTTNGPTVDTVAVRAWAAENWPEPVADKGRVPAAVVAAYEAAQLAQQLAPAGAATTGSTQEEVPVAPVNPGDIPAPEGIFAVPDPV